MPIRNIWDLGYSASERYISRSACKSFLCRNATFRTYQLTISKHSSSKGPFRYKTGNTNASMSQLEKHVTLCLSRMLILDIDNSGQIERFVRTVRAILSVEVFYSNSKSRSNLVSIEVPIFFRCSFCVAVEHCDTLKLF